LAAAKALTRKLRRDSDAVYPTIEWAVGMFRADASGATDCVVVSSEGCGYIPWGVFLPRSARTLAADKLVDNEFREHWFSPADPASVIAEYARVREGVRADARLVAVAVTTKGMEVHLPGVEFAVCPREWQDGVLRRPALDEMHQHRLETAYPEIFGRVQRLTDTQTHTREVENQVALAVAAHVIETVKTTANVEVPEQLRQMWNRTGIDDSIPSQAWNNYRIAAMAAAVMAGGNGPGPEADTGQRELYRGQWNVARAMELVWGLSPAAHELQQETGSVVWADMMYAAATTFEGRDFVAAVEPLVRKVENGRQQ
jgi:hypothetical protein